METSFLPTCYELRCSSCGRRTGLAAAVLGVDSLRTDKDLTRRSRSPQKDLTCGILFSHPVCREPMAIVLGQRRNPHKIASPFGAGALNGQNIDHDAVAANGAAPPPSKNRVRLAWTFAVLLLLGFSGAAWLGGFAYFRRAPERALSTLLAQPAAYQTGPVALGFQLVWYDRTGKQIQRAWKSSFLL